MSYQKAPTRLTILVNNDEKFRKERGMMRDQLDEKKGRTKYNVSKGLGNRINNRFRMKEEDIEKEYMLILQKKSNLSANQRKAICNYMQAKIADDVAKTVKNEP